MGQARAQKRPTRRVRKSITNYQLRITKNLKLFVILCVFCAFAGSSFAQTTESLADAVRSGTTEIKRDALLQIRNLQSAEASRLAIPALQDSSEIIRATAAFSVIFLPKQEAAQILLPLLNDKSELVRRETAYALGKVADLSATDSLIDIFRKDKIAEVRNASVVALGEIGDVKALDILTGVLQKKPIETDDFLRRSAARSIGQIAQITQLSETQTAEPKQKNLSESFPAFRAALSVLIKVLQNPKESQDAKREAAFALGEIGDASAIPALQANSSSEDYYLAEICKEALKKISSQ
jgi:HEAT repeat protein